MSNPYVYIVLTAQHHFFGAARTVEGAKGIAQEVDTRNGGTTPLDWLKVEDSPAWFAGGREDYVILVYKVRS